MWKMCLLGCCIDEKQQKKQITIVLQISFSKHTSRKALIINITHVYLTLKLLNMKSHTHTHRQIETVVV